jgi:hypothetical protein
VLLLGPKKSPTTDLVNSPYSWTMRLQVLSIKYLPCKARTERGTHNNLNLPDVPKVMVLHRWPRLRHGALDFSLMPYSPHKMLSCNAIVSPQLLPMALESPADYMEILHIGLKIELVSLCHQSW